MRKAGGPQGDSALTARLDMTYVRAGLAALVCRRPGELNRPDLQRFVPEDGATRSSSWITPERAAFDQAFEQEFALAVARARARRGGRWRQSQGWTSPVPSLEDDADEI